MRWSPSSAWSTTSARRVEVDRRRLRGEQVNRSEEEFAPGEGLTVATAVAADRERAAATDGWVRSGPPLTEPCRAEEGADLRWVLLHLINETARHAGRRRDAGAPRGPPGSGGGRETDRVTQRREVVLLGSTGSIGTQAIDVVRRNPDRFRVVGLAAGGGNVDLLARQALDLGVEVVAVARASAAQDLQLAFYAAAQAGGYSAGAPKILAGPGRRGRAGRLAAVRRRAQRHDRLDRPRADARRAGRRPDPRAGEQGVADRRRPAGQGRAAPARPAGAGRLRALGARPVPAAAAAVGGTPAGADGQRWPVPWPAPRRARRRHLERGARPPDLVDGTGRHHQLRHPGQQGRSR